MNSCPSNLLHKLAHLNMWNGRTDTIRRFLLHVLPSGFHRIRHYGLIANSGRRENLARARELLNVAPLAPKEMAAPNEAITPVFVCRDCGATMIVTGILARAPNIRAPPPCRGKL